MNIKYVFRYMVALFVLVSVIAIPQSVAAEDLAVEPAAGSQGSTFSFSGGGYEAEERISFWLTTPNGDTIGDEPYTTTADEEGFAFWTWRAPDDAAFGTWVMVGFGNSSRMAQTTSFTINRPEGLPDTPTGSAVEPLEGPLATTFSFNGSGFVADERISFWATSPNGAVVGDNSYTATADSSGVAQWNWTAPDRDDTNATPGRWHMIGFGNESQVSVVIQFTVTEDPARITDTSVEPPAGTPGTTFTFTVTGFDAEERVSYWITPPDRNVIGDESFYVSTDENGSATWTWAAPGDTQPGVWTMVAVGSDSREGQQIPFTISTE
ncbi:MAG: hypothetical protein GFH27_549371n37 [Chloroflexi bacterium AL-W]|nr:hypothetical protein [Chloroflexi bacterium AL-N1]NOK70898.1 hypothetical protein [Chloroflexi bacterium AL-N10]NOK78567.1 hypothetical protein [Chloroflexi bacterium AL-N5]NOK85799.1 hypothetical protein [Chloroflexi bacterium AL-W]NOK92715.1 hypothetical protein [Chloroflexi bacterium AL-N15]